MSEDGAYEDCFVPLKRGLAIKGPHPGGICRYLSYNLGKDCTHSWVHSI